MEITNSAQLLLFKLFLFLIIMILFITYYRRSAKKESINKVVFVLHMIVLGLFFTNRLDAISNVVIDMGVPYLVFDVIFDILWWSMSGIGIISCINLLKEKSKLAFFLLPTTFIFLLFIVPMMIISNMCML